MTKLEPLSRTFSVGDEVLVCVDSLDTLALVVTEILDNDSMVLGNYLIYDRRDGDSVAILSHNPNIKLDGIEKQSL